MSHTHAQFDLVRHTLNVVATHLVQQCHTGRFDRRNQRVTKSWHLHKFSPELFGQGSAEQGVVSSSWRSEPVYDSCFPFLDHLSLCWQSLKRCVGHLRTCARFACWPGKGRRATEDRWQRRRGGETPVIKAAPLLPATELGKSLNWLSKSKWHKQVWRNIANLFFFALLHKS